MMLSVKDILLIVGITAVCTAVVTGVALLIMRLNRRGSITSQFAVVVAAAPVAVVASTMAIASEMYVSQHDLQVLIWVVLISALLSLLAAVVTGRSARARMGAIRESALRIGDGEVVDDDAHGWKEFADVSTALADTSERLAAARAEIARLDASRRQFFAWISHDLRTPLTGVRAMAEVLEDGAAEDPADYARRIRVQVDTMSRLVDDLFDLSRIQSDALALHCESVGLLDIVSDAVADVAHIATDRDVRVVQAGIADCMLWADPHELTRVVVNLLTNSLRHAPSGSEILVSAHRSDDARVVLSVLDHGSGVAAEDLGHMFEIGWRANTARTPDKPTGTASAGAGLGLAIVRGIVEAHGGDVSAQHVPEGFRLDVVLPTAAG
ncbi:sensor histidine kinase [Gordonia insulae]|uniref:histidine kinase n=1 Tax=Gordonia insulae TaxID=2420509 RepID=A0A3G8JS62_9ACTN|nr:HAMP domain-containing sensor histidine kinase [Gordonia insulae]AZG47555.1 Sensor histidine kinase ResE [Gordonia insulae]